MREKRSEIDCLCLAFILFCIFEGLFGCFYSIFSITQMQNALQSYTTIFIPFAILCSFLFYNKKSTLILVPLMITFLSVLSGFFKKELLYFLQMLYSIIILHLNQYYGIRLVMFFNPDNMNLLLFKDGCLIFMLCAIFLLSIDITGLLRGGRILLLSAFLFIFGMFIGKLPSAFFIFLLLIGLLGLFSMKSKNQDFQKKWKLKKKTNITIDCEEQQEPKQTSVHSGQKAAIFTIICFLSALILGSFFENIFGKTLLSYHSYVQNWANKFEYNLLHYDYRNIFKNIGNISKNNGSQGRLSNAKIEYTGKEVLRITVTEKPVEAMYFRGFIGKDYNGNQWTSIDEKAFSNEVQNWVMENWEELKLEIENIPYTKLQYHSFIPDSIQIQYINAPNNYAYLPYFSQISNSIDLNADGIMMRKPTKKGTIATSFYTKTYLQSQTSLYRFYIRNNSEIHTQVDDLEKKYAHYAYKQYQNIPNTIPNLAKNCEKYKNSSIAQVTRFIQQYLRQEAEYSLDLNPVPYGQDFVEYFLYTQKKGYCIHFATAATLMYRLCHIPARFVEGYVAWPADFSKNANGTYTASILDNRAHAWTEIYYDDIGFLPVDMTPETTIRTMIEDTNTENNSIEEPVIDSEKEEIQKEELLIEEQKKEIEENKGEQKEESEIMKNSDERREDTNTKNNHTKKELSENSGIDIDSKNSTIFWKAFKIIIYRLRVPFLVLFTLLIIFFVLITCNIFYQKQNYKKQAKKMLVGINDEKRRKIICISCQLHAYLTLSGYEKAWKKIYGRELSNQDYETMIQKEFVFLEHKDYHKFYQTVQKALYCSPIKENIVSTKELRECKDFLKLIEGYLLEQTSGYKKLLLKHVLFQKKEEFEKL